jgi:hypothetical protein
MHLLEVVFVKVGVCGLIGMEARGVDGELRHLGTGRAQVRDLGH